MVAVEVIKADSQRSPRKRNKVKQIRVAPYCRVSTDSEEQLASYKSQVKYYKDLIASKPEWQLVQIYADEGISGTQTSKRVAFKRMINDAIEGKIDLIVTKSISRFARNTLDTLQYVRLLKENNVAIFFEKENINTMTMNGEMLLTILSSLAQQESESISANVKMGLRMKMKRGEMVGFQGCLGYDYDPETKTISINEEEAETVRYIFRRYIEGAGSYVIAKELTNLGVKTKRGNTKWSDSSVTRIIKNEKYKGDLLLGKTFTVDPITHRRLENMGEQEKYYVKDHHEPIISEEVFEEAQMILKKRSAKHNKEARGSKFSRKYAFSSKIQCAFCGGTAIRRKWHSGTDHESYNWQCGTSIKEGRKACTHSKGIKETLLEGAFVEAFNRLSKDNRQVIEEFVSDIEGALSVDENKVLLEEVEKEIAKLEKKAKKLLELKLNDKIDDKSYEEKYEELTDTLNKEKQKKMDLKIKIDEEASLIRRIKAFRKAFANVETMEEFDREIFESLVDKIILGREDEDGTINPYVITFVLNTGIKLDPIKPEDFKIGMGNYKHTFSSSQHDIPDKYSLSQHDTCGVSSID